MEAKLRKYRAACRRQELLIENTKETLGATQIKLGDILLPKLFNKMDKRKKDEEVFLVSNKFCGLFYNIFSFRTTKKSIFVSNNVILQIIKLN